MSDPQDSGGDPIVGLQTALYNSYEREIGWLRDEVDSLKSLCSSLRLQLEAANAQVKLLNDVVAAMVR